MIKYLVFLGSAWVQLSRTGKKLISVIVAIRPVFPDPVTYTIIMILLLLYSYKETMQWLPICTYIIYFTNCTLCKID